jgi:hypothetical protein
MGINRNEMDLLVTSVFENIIWVLYSMQEQVALVAAYDGSYFLECYNSRSDAVQGCAAYKLFTELPLGDVVPMALTFDQAREFAKLNDECWGLALVDNQRTLLGKHWVR